MNHRSTRVAATACRLIGFELKWFDGDGYLAIRLLDGEINFL